MPLVTIVNEGRTIEINEGTNLRKALLRNGASPYVGKDKILNCRGSGLCGTCRVEIVEGKNLPPMTDREEAALIGLLPFYARSVPPNVRLSCRLSVNGDLSLKMHPAVGIDRELTRERLILTAIWTFFGGSLLGVTIILLLDMVKAL